MLKNTNTAKLTAGFGAAAATLYAVPELNADVVSLTFSPGTVSFNTESDKRNVNLGTTGGASLGCSFGQYNDSVGKSLDTEAGILGLRLVSSGEVINTSTFTAGSSTSFSTAASGIVYIGFVTDGGNIGWFSVDLGGIGGDVTYNVEGGQYGSGGESLTVGNSTPAVPGLGGLAALAIGATGLRGRRQRAAAS